MNEKLLNYFNNDEFPAGVWSGKYQMKENGEAKEETPDDMHKRMAKEFARIEESYTYYNDENLSEFGKSLEFALLDKNEVYSYFKDFKYIIPQGSIMSILGNKYKVGSLSNCFVMPAPHDSYGGILYTDQQLAQLMKRRGGVGTNLNSLRFTKASVLNAAESSTGAPSFAGRFSNTTREVAQDGRRGALMLMLSCLHPDVFNWVKMKDDRTKVTGANITVMLTDNFMKAAEANEDFICRFPIEKEVGHKDNYKELEYNKIEQITKDTWIMKIKARELFDLIIEMAWKNGEPGLAFMDMVHNLSPDGVYEQFKAIASNPCVLGDTEIITPKGYVRIDSVVDQEIDVWNGYTWSRVTPKITGQNQHMLKITLSNGRSLTCTDYHKWILKGNNRVKSTDLEIGDEIEKYSFPVLEDNIHMDLNRSTQMFVTIKSIEDAGYAEKVYCFNEPKNHSAVFNGILTAQCGEQFLQAYDSCRLMALNLFSIVVNPFTKDAFIDYDKLYQISYVQQRLADDLVDLEMEYIQRIIKKVKNDPEPDYIKQNELDLWENIYKTAKAGRRTGCGFTALSDFLAAVGVKYDSEEGMVIIEKVCKTKMQAELDCTIDLAILRGTFEGWDNEKEFKVINGTSTPFINFKKGLLSSSRKEGYEIKGNNNFYKILVQEFPEQTLKMLNYGRRNISWSTVAPTGSLSIITKLIKNFNASAGIEPQFALWYFRNKKINPNDKGIRVDFVDQNGDAWQQFPIVMGAFKDWYGLNPTENLLLENMTPAQIQETFERSPWYGSTAPDIDWTKRVKIQAIVQRYTTNAISSTINLPENVKQEEVANIYWTAWKAGLKGITVNDMPL